MEQNLASSNNFQADEVIRHWLLNTAVEFGVPLTCLFPEISQGLNVKPIPGCSSEDYAGGLIELFNSSMITLSSEFPEDDVTTRAGVSRIFDHFLALPEDYKRIRHLRPSDPGSLTIDRNPAMQVDFKLTELGGEAWEKVAEPDWRRFFTQFSDYETGELTSPDLNLLMARMGWFRELSGERIQPDTITLQTHSDYPILYWKRLPHVYQAAFSVEAAKPQWANGHSGEPKWFREWWSSIGSWHKEPWDLPNW